MPDVIGDTPEEAAAKITNQGLIPRAPTSSPSPTPSEDGKVVKTSPAAGIPSREGTSVIIRVGMYTAQTTDTTQDGHDADRYDADRHHAGGGSTPPPVGQ